MIDEHTMAMYRRCEIIAKHSGRPLAEVLDEAGLLMTLDRSQAAKVLALTKLVEQIQDRGPAGFLGVSYHSGRHTALDMYNGILTWLREAVLYGRSRETTSGNR